MKKWMGFLVSVVCTLSSLQADAAPELELSETSTEIPVASMAPVESDEQAPKQVGKASSDAANTARRGNGGKYVLAATAVAVGVIAIILVSRHGGHHSH